MKQIHIIGGGTFSYVRNHLALSAPSFGKTARDLEKLCMERFPDMVVNSHLTKMANSDSSLVTNEDVVKLVDKLVDDLETKVIIFNAAICDFTGNILEVNHLSKSGKYETRLTSSLTYNLVLSPADKIIHKIRKTRKDIYLVAFKTTCGATEQEQYLAGLNLLKKNSCNLVLANDTKTYLNMIITPEEVKYHVTNNRQEVLKQLVDMVYYRSHLSFTRSTVVNGTPVPWNSSEVFSSLRVVVNHCIQRKAYKPFNGSTVGHFACKIEDREFLTSIRKSNFNDLAAKGLVRVKTDGEDSVMAYMLITRKSQKMRRVQYQKHS